VTRASAWSLVLLGLVAGCTTYRAATLASIEVGDEVAVTDRTGARISFEVTDVGPYGIAGERIRIGAGQVVRVEKRVTSLAPLGEGIELALRATLAFVYAVGTTFPVWAVLVL